MEQTKQYTILVPNDDLDLVTRKTLEAVGHSPTLRVITAGPGESQHGGIEAPPIRSKFDLRAVRFYRGLFKRYNIDATFSPSTSGLATMMLATIGHSNVRNIGYRGTQARVHRSDPANYLALLNPRMAHVVCETADIAQYLTSMVGAEKVSGMPKPFMLEWVDDAINNPQRVEGQPEGALKLIFIGISKGRPHKGLRPLLQAMERLKGLPVCLTVIGEAESSDIAMAPTNVTFLGQRPDAINFLPTHDVLMLTSTRDASPRVVREAQACGVPCIVTNIPGARDLIEDGVTGMLIEPGSVDAIERGIIAMLDKPDRRRAMAARTRRYIADNFSFENYINYFIKLFTDQCSR